VKGWRAKRKAARQQVDPAAHEYFESYLRWREACEDLRTAYERWANCAPAQRVLAFSGYRAALDREESTALVHSQLTERLSASAG
jgi:hypothetical protein